MNDTIALVAAVAAAVTSLITAIGGVIIAIIQVRQGKAIEKVHIATNSMKDALVKASGEAGELRGIQDEQARVKEEKIENRGK